VEDCNIKVLVEERSETTKSPSSLDLGRPEEMSLEKEPTMEGVERPPEDSEDEDNPFLTIGVVSSSNTDERRERDLEGFLVLDFSSVVALLDMDSTGVFGR
jgi:hypothetical protein